jgi:hypothetical protein
MLHLCQPFQLDGATLSSKRRDTFLDSAQPPSQLDPSVLLLGVKRLVRVAGYIATFSLEAKNECNYTSTTSICPQGMYRHSISLQCSWYITITTRFGRPRNLMSFSCRVRGISLLESVQNSFGGWFSLLFNAYQQLFRRQAEAGGAMRLTTRLNLMLSLRIRGALPPLPQIASRCGA